VITDPPILKIRRHFPRPSPDLVAGFAGASTGHLVDAMGGKGALDWRVKPLAGIEPHFCGVALTCDAGPGDMLALFAALDAARPGDVVVAATDGYRQAAVIGDVFVGMARNCGVAAIVTDGAMRDVVAVRAAGLPVWCTGVSPNSPSRCGPGTVGLPIVMSGLTIASGDIVVGDDDGVVVIPADIAAQMLSKLADVRKAEATLEEQIKAGLRMLGGVASLITSDRTEEILESSPPFKPSDS
jgi:4-hydroxy-4-methyl-2-oxoglutarate aldolase